MRHRTKSRDHTKFTPEIFFQTSSRETRSRRIDARMRVRSCSLIVRQFSPRGRSAISREIHLLSGLVKSAARGGGGGGLSNPNKRKLRVILSLIARVLSKALNSPIRSLFGYVRTRGAIRPSAAHARLLSRAIISDELRDIETASRLSAKRDESRVRTFSEDEDERRSFRLFNILRTMFSLQRRRSTGLSPFLALSA